MNALFFHPTRNRFRTLALILTGILIVLGVLVALTRPDSVHATSSYLSLATTKYPQISGTNLQSCSLCHTSSVPNLNPYGQAFRSNGSNSAAFGLIESLDSDGDGFTNLQEINALTFPGDGGSHPVVAPTATATRIQPTNTPTQVPPTATHIPPTATSVPPTATSIPPTATQVLPTATNVPPTTTSIPPTATSVPPTATPTLPPPPAGPTPTQPSEGKLKMNPVADAYVQANDPKSNFGSDTELKVKDAGDVSSYLRFRIPELGDGRSITKAILRLYVENSSGHGMVIHRVSGLAWSENQITYATAPEPGRVIAIANRLPEGQWISVNVTSLIREGDGSYSIAILARSGAGFTFASRESSDHAPELVLSMHGHGEDDEGDDDD